MIHLKITAVEKAKLKAFIAEEDKPKRAKVAKPITHVIKTKADFAGWCAQDPSAAKLFHKVYWTWQRSNAKAPASHGHHAAYTHAEWLVKTGIKAVSTLKHQLDRLESAGLIERSQHHHAGNRTLSFIRPTPLALTLVARFPSDWEHLGLSAPNETKNAKPFEALLAVYKDAYAAQVGTPLLVIGKDEKAALRQILKALPDDAIEVVGMAVREWKSFKTHVLISKAVTLSLSPSTIALNKNLQTATEFLAKIKHAAEQEELQVAQKAQWAAKFELQKSVYVPPIEEPKPTLEDLLADASAALD